MPDIDLSKAQPGSEWMRREGGMLESLKDYMKRMGPPPERPFEPKAMYFEQGDFLYVFFEDADHFHESHGPAMDLLRAFSDKRIIGAKLHQFSEVKGAPEYRALASKLAACLREVGDVWGSAFDEVSGGCHIPKGAVERFDAAFERAETLLAKAKAAGVLGDG